MRRKGRGLGEAAGREKPGAGGARGVASEKRPSVASRRLRCNRVVPGPRARAGCTYPAWVVPAAGARVPRVRHGADCAAAAALALPPGPPWSAPRGRRGTRARVAPSTALRSGLGPLRAHRAPLRLRGSGRAQAPLRKRLRPATPCLPVPVLPAARMAHSNTSTVPRGFCISSYSGSILIL